jgi:Cdc6-like AAA superfamily ATPase
MPEVTAVQEIVSAHFPKLWPSVEAGLATCATLLLADNANPVALIYMGPPSTGKTTVAKMFETAQFEGHLYPPLSATR